MCVWGGGFREGEEQEPVWQAKSKCRLARKVNSGILSFRRLVGPFRNQVEKVWKIIQKGLEVSKSWARESAGGLSVGGGEGEGGHI